MTPNEILTIAQDYMKNRKIDIVSPGEIGRKRDNKIEVIFFKPDALDPNVIVCLPDNRVWVDTVTKEVTWITQM